MFRPKETTLDVFGQLSESEFDTEDPISNKILKIVTRVRELLTLFYWETMFREDSFPVSAVLEVSALDSFDRDLVLVSDFLICLLCG